MTDAETRLRHPFDKYQRYQVASELLQLIDLEPGSAVLDVGGVSGAAEDFFGDYDVTIVDVDRSEAQRRKFVHASGAQLPFPDQSFDAVVSQDTLEHVPARERQAFLAEARRVARQALIVGAPFADPNVELAERALHEFIVARFGGGFPTLEEHAEHGLPNLTETVDLVANRGWPTAVLPSGYLPHWLAGMLVHHELLATGLPTLDELHAFYNATVSAADCRAPSYRHVVIAADRDPDKLKARVDTLRSGADASEGVAALGAIAHAVFTQRIQVVLQQPVEELHEQIADLERQVADREAHVDELWRQNEALRVAIVEEAHRSLSGVVLQKLGDIRHRRKVKR